MPTNAGVKLTSQIVRASKVLAPYLPAGVVLTSGWRTDEEQAALIIRFGGGTLVDGDLSKTFDEARKSKLIAWPGDSKHRPGLAFDTSGADLATIKAAVEKCVAEHPDAGIDLGASILETSNNCFHVAVTA